MAEKGIEKLERKGNKPEAPPPTKFTRIMNVFVFVAAIYVFFLSIQMMSKAMGLVGGSFAETLMKMTTNPLIGLFIGILVTAIVQSSSLTTTVIVCFVSAGTLSVENAIPMIMGANIGTTVTNLLVSLFMLSRKEEFTRAFPAAVVHDLFNILTVIVLLPVELLFHPLQTVAEWISTGFTGIGGLKIISPLQIIVAPLSNLIIKLLAGKWFLAIPVALVLLFLAMKYIVDGMRKIVGTKTEVLVDRYLFGDHPVWSR